MTDNIMQLLDIKAEYKKYVKFERETATECQCKCPFHKDKVASMSINIKKGLYYCHACNEKGNLFNFVAKLKSIPVADVINQYAIETGTIGHLDKTEISEKSIALLHNPKALKNLEQKKLINKETIKRFSIGFDGDRYLIPLKDSQGNIINVIKYKLTERKIADKTVFLKGRATTIFPYDNINKSDEIFLMEGLTDCLLANQLGLNAITAPNGANTWKREWTSMLAGKTVYICYDSDRPGKVGGHRVASHIYGIAKKVFFKFIKGAKDFNDLIKSGKSLDDFNKLDVVEYHGEDTNIKGEEKDLEVYKVTLAQASNAKYYNKRVKFKSVVVGKLLAPYIIPLECEIKCKKNFTEDSCNTCPINKTEVHEFKLSYEDHELLNLINVSSLVQAAVIKNKIGIPKRCNKHRIVRKTNINIEEITIAPEISHEEQDSKHVTRIAYVIGQDIETNKTYEFEAITLPDPTTQLATHLIYNIKNSESSIETFKLTPELHNALKVFRPKSNTLNAIDEKLKEKYKDYEAITHIHNRETMFLFIDLLFHSAREFVFQDRDIFKGYLDALIIGETRTGKSESVKQLIKHFKAGGRSSGESMSFAGLIGGLRQLQNGRWEISWGQAILHDLQEFTIDEAHELGPEFWNKLSDYRSSGIITINKIRTERAFGRTRLLTISNPPGTERSLAHYANGVEALHELVGRPEDIARFDMVMATLNDEVNPEVVNAKSKKSNIKTYTSELCHNMIMFAWSRVKENIIINEETEIAILKYAMEESKMFHPSIPLVQSSEQRIKLARMAAALAIMLYSTDDKGNVLVKPIHVEYVHNFLMKIYGYPLNYDKYSKKQYEKDTLKGQEYLITIIDEDKKEQFMEWDKLKQADLFDIFSDVRDREKVREIIGNLLKCKALRRVGTSYYVKTKPFIAFLNTVKFRSSNISNKPKF